MADLTFYWHDYETFGKSPRVDRPAQFAGVRTDAELNEIDAPLMQHCQPAPDVLPDPESCLITGIVPQACQQLGVPEPAFAAAIEAQLSRPGTVGVGYNSIRFDDEVTRHLFWRNLIDPYAREWQNECGRWDLLDVVRCTYALRPDGIVWPQHPDGRPSFKLEDLTAANGLTHDAAHDALSDVHATLSLARLIRRQQPRLFDFCLKLRKKDAVLAEMNQAQSQGRPFLHISGMYGPERGCLAVVWPLAPHPTNKNEVIVWDLAADPSELFTLNAGQIRQRLYTKAEDLPEGVTRLPIKSIHINKSPVVIANLKTLSADMAARWGVDMARSLAYADIAQRQAHLLAGVWPDVFARPASAQPPDVDEDLYGGFLSNNDRRTLERLRALTPEALADKTSARQPVFEDPRLDELLWRYRARNFPEHLTEAEQPRWAAQCAARLQQGGPGRLSLQGFFDRIDQLAEGLADDDERGQDVLGALYEYGTELGDRFSD